MKMLRKYAISLLGVGCALLVMVSLSEAGPLIGPGRDDFDRETGQVTGDNLQLNYEFFRPPGYESAGQLPLVIFLHGFSDGRSSKQSRLNETMLDLVYATQRENARRAPAPTHTPRTHSNPPSSSELFNAEQFDDDYQAYLLTPKIPIVEGWFSYLDLAKELIDDVSNRYQIDTRRIFLTGFSNGGFATPDMIERYPNTFAAGVPISGGGFPSPSKVGALKEVPLWFFHGENDRAVNPSFSIDLADALVAAGGDPRLTLVPGGHNAGYEFAFRDAENQFYPWLLSQSLPVPEPSTGILAVLAVIPLLLRSSRLGSR